MPFVLHGHALSNEIPAGLLIYGLAAIVVLRFGLLALTMGFCVAGLIGVPLTMHTDAWYFPNITFLFVSAVVIATWAFFTSIGGRRFWPSDLLALGA